MFIVGGENYQPEMVENIIMDSTLVEKAIIVGVQDDEFGTLPVAFIDWVDAPKPNLLSTYLIEKVAQIQIPKHFIPWPATVGDSLKPNRKWFVQHAVQQLTNNIKMDKR